MDMVLDVANTLNANILICMELAWFMFKNNFV